MAKKPTVADAQLILQLYDLRRETEMRKARHWWHAEFFPQSADEFLRVSQAAGTQENNWLRQALGYWGMTTSFVLKGVLNEELFLEPAFSGEMFLMFAKLQPILKELRAWRPTSFPQSGRGGHAHQVWTRAPATFGQACRDDAAKESRATSQVRPMLAVLPDMCPGPFLRLTII